MKGAIEHTTSGHYHESLNNDFNLQMRTPWYGACQQHEQSLHYRQ